MDKISIVECEKRWALMSDSERKQEYLDLCQKLHSMMAIIPAWIYDATARHDGHDRGLPEHEASEMAFAAYVLRWEGATWSVGFQNEKKRVRDLVGVRYIAVLLANPKVRYSPLELAQACGRFKEPAGLHKIDLNAEGVAVEQGFSYQPKADQRTIAEIRYRIKEYEEINAGSPVENLARKEELQALYGYLQQVTNRSGSARHYSGKARGLPTVGAVGKAITDAFNEMKRCGLFSLGHHLRRSIYPYSDPVAYLPDNDRISWLVTGPNFQPAK